LPEEEERPGGARRWRAGSGRSMQMCNKDRRFRLDIHPMSCNWNSFFIIYSCRLIV
jgi:hypothetical protein